MYVMSHCNDLIALTVTLGSNWSHVGQVPCGLHHAGIVPFLLSSVFLLALVHFWPACSGHPISVFRGIRRLSMWVFDGRNGSERDMLFSFPGGATT